MNEPLNVLMVEDSASDAKLIVYELGRTGRVVDFERVENADALRSALDRRSWDLVLSDSSMPSFGARAALAIVQEASLDVPFIIVSGTIGEEAAVEAMRAGARDFVLKDQLARLNPAVEREILARSVRDAKRLSEQNAARMAEELRQAQKMEAVGKLAGGIAHDFNNVLSVIISCADLVLEDLKPGAPMYDDVKAIRDAGGRAANLTRQLLMFTRQQVLVSKVIDLNKVLSGLDNMLRRMLGEDVILVVLPAEALSGVRADPSSIEQVIMNLVVNARDAMPIGGKLTIETANVDLDEAYTRSHPGVTGGRQVLLAVTDVGSGIDAVTMARVFEPFFTTKAVGKGTGLGLSTVLGIVQQSGGSVWVDTLPGHGTTVNVFFPCVDEAIDSSHTTIPPAGLHGSETILLVDDDDEVRAVTRAILLKNGYDVIDACGGREALRLAEEYSGVIHLLISDVVMPEMSGPELAKRLTKARPEVAVLCMSGYTDDSIVRHGVLEARIEFLQKPITPAALAVRVRQLLDALQVQRTN
jgi:two-component system, cell cycle sensor histidine kinase and response regulator CckA